MPEAGFEVSSSIGTNTLDELTGADSRENLAKDLTAYAKELAAKIQQIEDDARELANRAGIDYVEPTPLVTLRNELTRAKEGIDHANNPAADARKVWSALSPMVRPAAK